MARAYKNMARPVGLNKGYTGKSDFKGWADAARQGKKDKAIANLGKSDKPNTSSLDKKIANLEKQIADTDKHIGRAERSLERAEEREAKSVAKENEAVVPGEKLDEAPADKITEALKESEAKEDSSEAVTATEALTESVTDDESTDGKAEEEKTVEALIKQKTPAQTDGITDDISKDVDANSEVGEAKQKTATVGDVNTGGTETSNKSTVTTNETYAEDLKEIKESKDLEALKEMRKNATGLSQDKIQYLDLLIEDWEKKGKQEETSVAKVTYNADDGGPDDGFKYEQYGVLDKVMYKPNDGGYIPNTTKKERGYR